MKNLIIRILTKLFGKERYFTESPERILIVSTTGFGDSLWATPAIRALNARYLAVLTSPIGAKLFAKNPHINEIFVCPNNAIRRFFPLLKALKQKKFDTIYLFHASQRPIFPLISLLGASRLIGNQGMNKGLDSLFTTLKPVQNIHEIHRRLDLIGENDADPKLEVFFAPSQISSKQTVCLHPGAKDPFKFWPKEHFITLGRRIQNELGLDVLVSGTPGEKELVESICKEIPDARPLIAPLEEFTEALISTKAFVTNDTGPMHLAFALDVKTLAIFGPTDPKLCGPIKANATVLSVNPTCTPCLKKRCSSPICMYQIGVDQVWSSLLSLIGTEKKTPSPALTPLST